MQPASAATASVDATAHFAKRKKTSLWFAISLLVVSLFILTIGLAATTRTENITVGGYYPGIILGFGSFLGIIGIHLVENRKQMIPEPSQFWQLKEQTVPTPDAALYKRYCAPSPTLSKGPAVLRYFFKLLNIVMQTLSIILYSFRVLQTLGLLAGDYNHIVRAMSKKRAFCHSWDGSCWELVASIVFISFGVVAAFCCAIVDGVFAARHIEPRPLNSGRCNFYASGSGLAYDTQQTEVTCSTANRKCQLRVKTHTCYCCDLYDCENADHVTSYYEFAGVSSCQDVLHLYRLLWTCTVLNIVGLFLGIVTAAVLGAFKDIAPISQLNYNVPPPQILYNPAQQILTYTGFCSPTSSLPSYASCPLPLQPSGSYPATSSADISLSDDNPNPSHSMNGLTSNLHSQYASTILLPGEKPPPYAP